MPFTEDQDGPESDSGSRPSVAVPGEMPALFPGGMPNPLTWGESRVQTLPLSRLYPFPIESSLMSRICMISGAKPFRGRRIHHSGKAKKEGGIGLNHVKKVNRTFTPNLRDKRIWVPELN